MALVVLSAAVMKADGKIMKSELNYVKSFLKVNFGPKESEQMLLILRTVLTGKHRLQADRFSD